MPYLWSTIRVSEYHSPNEVQFMHEWLSRAGAVPKTLFLGLEHEEKGMFWVPSTLFLLHIPSKIVGFSSLLLCQGRRSRHCFAQSIIGTPGKFESR